jgi:hypothetical protein
MSNNNKAISLNATTHKNVFQTTTNKPLRFAILGPHNSSKSSLVSIIVNNIALDNYYPTLQNSPILFQFQPKRPTSRAVLDINVSLTDLQELGLLQDDHLVSENTAQNPQNSIYLSPRLLNTVHATSIVKLKHKDDPTTLANSYSTEQILAHTKHAYDLDYSQPDLFAHESFSPIGSAHSPIASFSRGRASGLSFNNSVGRLFPTRSLSPNGCSSTNKHYSPPVTTPILVELIDTPGVQADDLIPFLERSLDSRLSKDLLSNLANDYNTNFRSRVKPLITGSGISDLNASVDAYLLTYSAVPEHSTNPPPLDNEFTETNPSTNSKSSPLYVIQRIHAAIVDAWKEYFHYSQGWEQGKEHDSLSISASIKQLWKQNNNKTSSISSNTSTSGTGFPPPTHPPIVVLCTHIDSPYASPVLISQGRSLAKKWGTSFLEVCCSPSIEQWKNVEEALAVAIREAISQ